MRQDEEQQRAPNPIFPRTIPQAICHFLQLLANAVANTLSPNARQNFKTPMLQIMRRGLPDQKNTFTLKSVSTVPLHTTAQVLCMILALGGVAPRSQAQTQQAPDAAQIEKLQKQLESLQNQMNEVQAQLNRFKTEPTTTPASAPATGTISTSEKEKADAEVVLGTKSQDISQATASYETTSQDQLAASRIDNEPLDPRYPGYFRLPGTKTFLRIGGYFKTDFIYDLKPAGSAESFIPSSIPIPSPVTVNNTTISVRPTRLNLDFLIPGGSAGNVRFFIEGDLFGSNATTPRMRHAYAQVKNLLIGQTFSNFMDPDSGPDTLDFQGPNAQVSLRNPQIRYGFKIRPKTTFTLAVEKASSDISFKVQDFTTQPNSPSPDGTLQLRRELNSGHVQLAALFRTVGGYLANGATDSVVAWGFNLTGAEKVGQDRAVYQIEYGNGIQRYINDTSGLGIDAALKSTVDPHLKALPVTGAYGGYQHYWLPRLRSSLVYGYVQSQNTAYQPGSTFHQSNYSAGNVIWNPIGSLNVGTEFLYGWRVNKDGSSGNAPRIMFSAKYNFVKLQDTKK